MPCHSMPSGHLDTKAVHHSLWVQNGNYNDLIIELIENEHFSNTKGSEKRNSVSNLECFLKNAYALPCFFNTNT